MNDDFGIELSSIEADSELIDEHDEYDPLLSD